MPRSTTIGATPAISGAITIPLPIATVTGICIPISTIMPIWLVTGIAIPGGCARPDRHHHRYPSADTVPMAIATPITIRHHHCDARPYQYPLRLIPIPFPAIATLMAIIYSKSNYNGHHHYQHHEYVHRHRHSTPNGPIICTPIPITTAAIPIRIGIPIPIDGLNRMNGLNTIHIAIATAVNAPVCIRITITIPM
ncbi:hypothetical protein FN846DRAFT_885736 [Sphaerosporella brunnea]|uniref:Uncharacterized protein n=1 Tax=Sphaerosporella brunnea TaxID=1250544 RepID=A0A5J5FCD9_9PEZI|nr:hypothetical protein FN846DRAFT_885736 [Sphaerosporella brunnea]